MLQEFFAVTTTSVYRVKARDERSGYPSAKKVALRGESEGSVGYELEDGTMISVGNQLRAYIPEGGGITSYERRIELVNTRYWGGHSSEIVALFKSEDEAMKCLQEDDRKPCDERWLDKTKEVLGEIGKDHPAFSVCRHPRLGIMSQ